MKDHDAQRVVDREWGEDACDGLYGTHVGSCDADSLEDLQKRWGQEFSNCLLQCTLCFRSMKPRAFVTHTLDHAELMVTADGPDTWNKTDMINGVSLEKLVGHLLQHKCSWPGCASAFVSKQHLRLHSTKHATVLQAPVPRHLAGGSWLGSAGANAFKDITGFDVPNLLGLHVSGMSKQALLPPAQPATFADLGIHEKATKAFEAHGVVGASSRISSTPIVSCGVCSKQLTSDCSLWEHRRESHRALFPGLPEKPPLAPATANDQSRRDDGAQSDEHNPLTTSAGTRTGRKPYNSKTRPRVRGKYKCGVCGFASKAQTHDCQAELVKRQLMARANGMDPAAIDKQRGKWRKPLHQRVHQPTIEYVERDGTAQQDPLGQWLLSGLAPKQSDAGRDGSGAAAGAHFSRQDGSAVFEQLLLHPVRDAAPWKNVSTKKKSARRVRDACITPGCTTESRAASQFCFKHNGQAAECTVAGCIKRARSGYNFCYTHRSALGRQVKARPGLASAHLPLGPALQTPSHEPEPTPPLAAQAFEAVDVDGFVFYGSATAFPKPLVSSNGRDAKKSRPHDGHAASQARKRVARAPASTVLKSKATAMLDTVHVDTTKVQNTLARHKPANLTQRNGSPAIPPPRNLKPWPSNASENRNKKKLHVLPFEKALVFARSLNLTSSTQWNAFSKSGARPSNIPSNPHRTYQHSGFISYRHWLGVEIAKQPRALPSAHTVFGDRGAGQPAVLTPPAAPHVKARCSINLAGSAAKMPAYGGHGPKMASLPRGELVPLSLSEKQPARARAPNHDATPPYGHWTSDSAPARWDASGSRGPSQESASAASYKNVVWYDDASSTDTYSRGSAGLKLKRLFSHSEAGSATAKLARACGTATQLPLQDIDTAKASQNLPKRACHVKPSSLIGKHVVETSKGPATCNQVALRNRLLRLTQATAPSPAPPTSPAGRMSLSVVDTARFDKAPEISPCRLSFRTPPSSINNSNGSKPTAGLKAADASSCFGAARQIIATAVQPHVPSLGGLPRAGETRQANPPELGSPAHRNPKTKAPTAWPRVATTNKKPLLEGTSGSSVQSKPMPVLAPPKASEGSRQLLDKNKKDAEKRALTKEEENFNAWYSKQSAGAARSLTLAGIMPASTSIATVPKATETIAKRSNAAPVGAAKGAAATAMARARAKASVAMAAAAAKTAAAAAAMATVTAKTAAVAATAAKTTAPVTAPAPTTAATSAAATNTTALVTAPVTTASATAAAKAKATAPVTAPVTMASATAATTATEDSTGATRNTTAPARTHSTVVAGATTTEGGTASMCNTTAPTPVPAPVVLEGVFDIAQVLAHRKRKRKVFYLIRWQGYSDEHNTWEPEKNVSHCKHLLAAYWKENERRKTDKRAEKHKLAAKRIEELTP